MKTRYVINSDLPSALSASSGNDSLHLYDFFYEAVQHLCSSLILEELIINFWNFLRRHVPITAFVMGRSFSNTQYLFIFGACSEQGIRYINKKFVISPRQLHCLNHISDEEFAQSESPMGLYATSEESSLVQFYKEPADDGASLAPHPLFFMRMGYEGTVVNSATFSCSPENPFTEEHLQLLRMLRTPLLIAYHNWIQYSELQELKNEIWQENLRLRHQLNGFTSVEVIGAKGGLRRVMEKIRLAGPVEVPVLITGETGTGKEVIARAVHELSPRKHMQFVAVNCGGIPPSLIDSELFGHVKGAFTGAVNQHKGRFERAHGGTIFLDEVGELPLDVQARLLRVLQERAIERVGGNMPISVDFRLIAATHRNLLQMVEDGRFREDLYYRLRVVHIPLPPLRERKQDIPLLVEHLLRRTALRFGILPPTLAFGEMTKLLEYAWPGNVREMQNVLEEALVFNPTGPLQFWVDGESRPAPHTPSVLPTLDGNLARYFQDLLAACGGRIAGPGGAAEKAGLHPNTLRSKLAKLGILRRNA